MLSKKPKGLFVEFNRFSVLTATSSNLVPPFTIEEVNEFPIKDLEPLEEYLESLLSKKGVRYIPSHCSVFPKSRFLRRHTVESMAKAKDPSYFDDLLETQFKLDPSKSKYFAINAKNGQQFDTDRPLSNQKELVICGAETKELDAFQESLVNCNAIPETLQLGTLSSLAGLMNYLKFKKINDPVLVFEVMPENSNLFILTAEQIDLSRPIPFGINSMFPLIQQELGLKDEASARKLLHSDTFDFTEMGATLLRKALKELQASTGFYEVQTGQTIPHLMVYGLPQNLTWIPQVITSEIGIEPLKLSLSDWLKSLNVEISDSVHVDSLNSKWFGLVSLLVQFEQESNGGKKEK